jgi:hypothetical protein
VGSETREAIQQLLSCMSVNVCHNGCRYCFPRIVDIGTVRSTCSGTCDGCKDWPYNDDDAATYDQLHFAASDIGQI